jgi:hypothetical protein
VASEGGCPWVERERRWQWYALLHSFDHHGAERPVSLAGFPAVSMTFVSAAESADTQ